MEAQPTTVTLGLSGSMQPRKSCQEEESSPWEAKELWSAGRGRNIFPPGDQGGVICGVGDPLGHRWVLPCPTTITNGLEQQPKLWRMWSLGLSGTPELWRFGDTASQPPRPLEMMAEGNSEVIAEERHYWYCCDPKSNCENEGCTFPTTLHCVGPFSRRLKRSLNVLFPNCRQRMTGER